jgi:Flp pilus assembly protein TadG
MRLRTRDTRPGAAAVELAFLLPFLMFLGVVTTDWARIMYYTITLENATRAGALYACDNIAQLRSPSDPSVTTNGTQSSLLTGTQYAASAESSDLGASITVNSVTNTTDSEGNAAVIVNASIPFKTITGFSYGKMFAVENNVTLTRTVQMRVIPTTTK